MYKSAYSVVLNAVKNIDAMGNIGLSVEAESVGRVGPVKLVVTG